MAHDVTFSVPEGSLRTADFSRIQSEQRRRSCRPAKVSKGSVVWAPRNLTYRFKLNRTQLNPLALDTRGNRVLQDAMGLIQARPK